MSGKLCGDQLGPQAWFPCFPPSLPFPCGRSTYGPCSSSWSYCPGTPRSRPPCIHRPSSEAWCCSSSRPTDTLFRVPGSVPPLGSLQGTSWPRRAAPTLSAAPATTATEPSPTKNDRRVNCTISFSPPLSNADADRRRLQLFIHTEGRRAVMRWLDEASGV